MPFDPSQDRWTSACDLCGSLRAQPLHLPISVGAHRCRSCGLVTLEHDAATAPTTAQRSMSLRSSIRTLEAAIRRAADDGAERALLIGRSSGRVYEALRKSGIEVTVLGEQGEEPPEGAIFHTVRVEQAPFLPDQFDIVLCTTAIETFDSPATVFEKSRMWLAPGGLLVLGGMNWGAIGARFTKRSWLVRHAMRSNYLMTPRILRRYADRFGYNVRTAQTFPRFDRSSDNSAPAERTAVSRILLAPVRLALSIVGMGDEVYLELVKRGVAPITIPARVEEERDASPGLAPAMYGALRAKEK
jgi:SAM-dependent methyltransferase